MNDFDDIKNNDKLILNLLEIKPTRFYVGNLMPGFLLQYDRYIVFIYEDPGFHYLSASTPKRSASWHFKLIGDNEGEYSISKEIFEKAREYHNNIPLDEYDQFRKAINTELRKLKIDKIED
jgi:hypothetical protein